MMRRPKQKTPEELQAQCIVWNQRYRVGTPVIYHPVIGEKAGRETRTRGTAYVLGNHTAVVFVEGQAGCVALDAVEVILENALPQTGATLHV